MGDFRRTAFRRKTRSGGSDEQPEEETGEFIWTCKVKSVNTRIKQHPAEPDRITVCDHLLSVYSL